MIGPRPDCMDCKHFDENNFNGLTCKAFPKGIPDEIIVEQVKHQEKRNDQDGNYVFERKAK